MASNKTTLAKATQGYGYKYTELADINAECERQGITYRQYIDYLPEANADYVMTMLTVNGKESEPMRGCRIVGGGVGKNAAQDQGAAITYARRYSLLMALGWATEDDDAASLTQKSNGSRSSVEKSKGFPSKSPKSIDFDNLRLALAETKSVDDLNKLWANDYAKRGMSPKQTQLVTEIFKEAKERILAEAPEPTDAELEAF